MPWAALAAAAVTSVVSNNNSRRAERAARNASDAQNAVMSRQLDMAEDQYARYLDVFAPAEDRFVQEALDAGSQANRERAAAEAKATVDSTYAGLMQRLRETPGLDPSSERYQKAVAKLGITQAAQSAAAQSGARTQAEQIGTARLQDVVSLGKGLPGGAASALAAAGASANGIAGSAMNQQMILGQQQANLGRTLGDVFASPGVRGLFQTTPTMTPAPSGSAASVNPPGAQADDFVINT